MRFGGAIIVMSAIMGLAPTPASAHRNQMRLYPATLWQLRGDDQAASMQRNANYSQFGWLENTHDSRDMHIVCPIDRWSPITSTGVRVSIQFRSGSPRFACTLFNTRESGEGSQSSRTNSPQDRADGDLFLALNSSNRAQNIEDPVGAYMLSCLLPQVEAGKRSRLTSYTVQEND